MFDDNNVWIPYHAISTEKTPMHKFKKNDKIINKSTRVSGTILSAATDSLGKEQYYVQYDNSWYHNTFEYEENLEPYHCSTNNTGPKCECGADSTYGVDYNAHSHWCPKSKGD